MSLRSLEYASVESIVAIKRNALMSLASIITVGLALSILGGFVLLTLGLHNATHTLLKRFEIAVYVQKGTSLSDVAALSIKIKALPHVKSVALISSDAAWKQFRREMGSKVELSGVRDNPLPDTLRVRVDDPKSTGSVASSITRMNKVDEVNEGRKEVDQVLRFANIIKMIGGATAGLLFLVTAFIISNTIRMTVYTRRREIRVMQLVGATNWFIRMPFIFEGAVLGALGGGIACGIVFGGAYYATQTVSQMMPLMREFSNSVDPVQFFGGLAALGCFLGMMSSLISVRRFLKS